jgi:very-short-patch-repair endonuclease
MNKPLTIHQISKWRFQHAVESEITGYEENVLSQIESPIEKILAAHLVLLDPYDYGNSIRWYFDEGRHDDIIHCIHNDPRWMSDEEAVNGVYSVFPQYRIGRYRVDFLVMRSEIDYLLNYPLVKSEKVIVECDGHDFHEKTKAQAAHDKKRDRFLQSKGMKVFRFTGTEIFGDCVSCVREIYQAITLTIKGNPCPFLDEEEIEDLKNA